MNNQTLVIYDFDTLYQILKEIDNYLNFKLINVEGRKLPKTKKRAKVVEA